MHSSATFLTLNPVILVWGRDQSINDSEVSVKPVAIHPTQHVLYFGIQAKKGKLDASGVSKSTNSNVAEIHNQVLMMLGHEIFDSETNRKVLVDHAFIVAGGEITKQARNWLGGKLDASKRSQIMFMDREDILNLYIVSNLPLPNAALVSDEAAAGDDIPF